MQSKEEHDEIIVFRHYQTAIDGNLAKTKLDAYGIPCFLTEENFSTLYTNQSFQLFGVRLHIFKRDSDQAKEVLNDQVASEHVCPKCKSQKVEIEYSRKVLPLLGTVLMFILFLGLVPVKKVHRCQQCGFEF